MKFTEQKAEMPLEKPVRLFGPHGDTSHFTYTGELL